MECQLCLLKEGEHTTTARGLCGYCAEALVKRIEHLEVGLKVVTALLEKHEEKDDEDY